MSTGLTGSAAVTAERLTAIGLRPISALVDITNYLTFDLCRPLHAFDAGKVAGDGTHDELMASCEVYRQIAASQLDDAFEEVGR